MITAVDNETFLIDRLSPLPQVVCTSYAEHDGVSGVLSANSEDFFSFWVTLLSGEGLIVGHNIAYDMGTLVHSYPMLMELVLDAYADGRIYDTMINQQYYDIATGQVFGKDGVKYYSLDGLSRLLFGEHLVGKSKIIDEADGWRLRYRELYNVPVSDYPAEAYNYSLQDAEVTLHIYLEQSEAIGDMLVDVPNEAFSQFCLLQATAYGMLTDTDKVFELETRLLQLLGSQGSALEFEGLLVNGVKKSKPLQQLVYDFFEGKPPETPSGKVSTSKATLRRMDTPIVRTLMEYRVTEKLLSTYIPVLREGSRLPVTTSFGLAATGRTTSKAPMPPLVGTNLQNAPRNGGIRECYKPREGYAFLYGDFSGAELHTLAEVCLDVVGYSQLGDTLADGKDVHSWVGSMLLDMSYEDFMLELSKGNKQVKEARSRAKPANFGFPAGMGIATFIEQQMKDTGRLWTPVEVGHLKDAWLKAFPEMREYFDYIQQLTAYGDTVIQIHGTQMLRKVLGFSMCANTMFQGSAAYGAKKAIQEVMRSIHFGALKGAHFVNFIHDEILLEIPIGDSAHYGKYLASIMEEAFNGAVCPNYPTKCEVVASMTWSKSAESVYDDDGRLCLWSE